MKKEKVYVCFDYERDKIYKFLMSAWDANPNFEFCFNDQSPTEIQSNDVSVIKGCLSKKIASATYTIILAGKDINKQHPDHKKIGYTNWQNFEIERSLLYGNKLILVQLPEYTETPEEAKGHITERVYTYNENLIIKALEKAAKK